MGLVMKKLKNEQKVLICTIHGITNFYKTGIKNIRWKCCKCDYDYSRKYLLQLRLKALEYKGNKCKLCDYSKSVWALDFHHRDPSQKDFNIFENNPSRKAVREWIKIKIELDKCDLLCKNCHSELHHNEYSERQKVLKLYLGLHKKEVHRINYLILTGQSKAEEEMNKILARRK